MIWLIIIAWYLSGAIGILLALYKISGELTVADLIICLTAGGICGFVACIIGVMYVTETPNWLKKGII